MNSKSSSTGPTFSFEIFPPNTQVGAEKIITTLEALQGLSPDFISVTCSGDKTKIEQTTIKLADYVANQLHIPAVAHLPAAYLDKPQVARILQELEAAGVTRILALRGDIDPAVPPKNDFHYADDLVRFITECAPHFEVSGACYPEVHPESFNQLSDIRFLKQKTAAGCKHLTTQLFFDNEIFFDFEEHCRLAEINVPILAGVMPITNRKQALRLIKTSSAKLPRKFTAILDRYEHDPVALRDAGIAYAVDQIADLVTQGVAGVHLYTMNNAETARTIFNATHSLFRACQNEPAPQALFA